MIIKLTDKTTKNSSHNLGYWVIICINFAELKAWL